MREFINTRPVLQEMLKLILQIEVNNNKQQHKTIQNCKTQNFPGGAVVKNPPANAGDPGSNPGLGRSHMP